MEDYGPVTNAFLGTLFTWGVTALGSAVVFFATPQRIVLDCSLGFAAGVMLAASYWSLLAPAIDLAEETYGDFAFLPVAIGFMIGAAFLHGAEIVLKRYGIGEHEELASLVLDRDSNSTDPAGPTNSAPDSVTVKGFATGPSTTLKQRRPVTAPDEGPNEMWHVSKEVKARTWKRTLLLILAVTVHNIPEGLAVGVAFGSVGLVKSASFASARNLAIGIGLQNFPEGLAVSMPLHRSGYSKWRSFVFGQFSGMVEPVAGVLGALAVTLVQPVLPYALAFAAGAMVYVVFDDIIPETIASGNNKAATWSAMFGFVVMMSMDVGLG